MSANLPRSRRQLERRDGRDIVYCHSCEHQWYIASQNASAPPPCPICDSGAIELVSEDDPRQFHTEILNPFEALMGFAGPGNSHFRIHDFFRPPGPGHLHDDDDDDPHIPGSFNDHNHHHDHYHGANRHVPVNDSDPEEADIGDVEEHDTYGPNGIYMYRTVSSFQNGRPNNGGPRRTASGRPVGVIDPSDPTHIMTTFGNMLESFRTAQTGRSGPETLFGSGNRGGNNEPMGTGMPGIPVRQVHQTTFSGQRFRGGTTSFTIATGPVRAGTGPPGDFNTIFTNIIGNVGPPTFGEEQERPAGMPPAFPDALRGLLATLLGSREGNVFGDAVHSDEALDRIISMLMENNPPSNGAPPATQTAIEQLERQTVDAKLLGPEGHAECTICISSVQLGEEVLSLPCKHWFHEECVVMWLKQHNTCPVCRNPVDNGSGGAEGAAANGNASDNSPPSNSSNNAGGGIFAIPGAFGSTPGSASGSASPGTASSGLGGDRGGANSQTGPGSISGASFPAGFRLSTALPAAQLAQQMERLDAVRMMRAGASSNRYRSPRDSERSLSDRRRRDSHSPNPGPPYMTSRRYNVDQDLDDIYVAPVVAREDSASSSHSRPWSTASYNSGSSGGQNLWTGGEQSRRARERNPERNPERDPERSQHRERQRERQYEHMWSSTSLRDRSRGSLYAESIPGAVPSGRPSSWMPGRYPNLGGDGAYDRGTSANASPGSNGSGSTVGGSRIGHDGAGPGTGAGNNTGADSGSGSTGHSGSSGGLFSFLNRFRDSGNSQSSSSSRRRS